LQGLTIQSIGFQVFRPCFVSADTASTDINRNTLFKAALKSVCSLSDLKTQENRTAEVPKLTESSPARATVPQFSVQWVWQSTEMYFHRHHYRG